MTAQSCANSQSLALSSFWRQSKFLSLTPALTMTLISKLAIKTGAAVICGYAKRSYQDKGKFNIIFKTVHADIYSEDILTSVSAINRSVESCVMDCLDQYHWEYKRFKKRPQGSPHLY